MWLALWWECVGLQLWWAAAPSSLALETQHVKVKQDLSVHILAFWVVVGDSGLIYGFGGWRGKQRLKWAETAFYQLLRYVSQEWDISWVSAPRRNTGSCSTFRAPVESSCLSLHCWRRWVIFAPISRFSKAPASLQRQIWHPVWLESKPVAQWMCLFKHFPFQRGRVLVCFATQTGLVFSLKDRNGERWRWQL